MLFPHENELSRMPELYAMLCPPRLKATSEFQVQEGCGNRGRGASPLALQHRNFCVQCMAERCIVTQAFLVGSPG